MKLWQWIKDLYAREPVMFNAVILSLVTTVVTWLASTGWLDLTPSQQDNLVGWAVAFVIAILTGGVVTRQSVYSPATIKSIAGTPAPPETDYAKVNYTVFTSDNHYTSDPKAEAAYYPPPPTPGEGQGPGGGG